MSEASEAGRGHSKGTSFHRPRTDAGAETNAASPWPGLQPQEPRENKCLLFNPPAWVLFCYSSLSWLTQAP